MENSCPGLIASKLFHVAISVSSESLENGNVFISSPEAWSLNSYIGAQLNSYTAKVKMQFILDVIREQEVDRSCICYVSTIRPPKTHYM